MAAKASRKGLASARDARRQFEAKLRQEKPNGIKFKAETYMVVMRWTERTRVSYVPNPKTVGSKSHPRYEKYSKARTVGEALSLGAYPADLLWDFERSYLRILGGPRRAEPVDVHRADALGEQLTQTDRVLGRWMLREMCKELGTTLGKVREEAGVGESGVTHALRLMADKAAREMLAAAKAEGRRISNEELLAALRRWSFAKNPHRVNVMPEGQSYVNSDTVGLTCDRQGDVHPTRATLMYPHVIALLCKWLTERQTDKLGAAPLPFTSINMNFGYAARRHRDGNNMGLSMLAAFGDFSGGELRYWGDDVGGCPVESLPAPGATSVDIKKDLLLFDGHRCHEVAPFKGERYSLVWFTCARYQKAGEANLKMLSGCGFAIPTDKAYKSAVRLLRRPQGYGGAAPRAGLRPKTAPVGGPGGRRTSLTWPMASLGQAPKRKLPARSSQWAPAPGKRARPGG